MPKLLLRLTNGKQFSLNNVHVSNNNPEQAQQCAKFPITHKLCDQKVHQTNLSPGSFLKS